MPKDIRKLLDALENVMGDRSRCTPAGKGAKGFWRTWIQL